MLYEHRYTIWRAMICHTIFFCLLIACGNFVAFASERVTYTRPAFRSIRFVDDFHGWMAGYRGIFYTTDGGRTWRKERVKVGSTTKKPATLTDTFNGVIVWADRQHVMIRCDGGLLFGNSKTGKWKKIRIDQNILDSIHALTFVDQRHGWGVGVSGSAYYTDDGGTTWKEVNTSVSTLLRGLSVISPNEIWIVADEGLVLHTKDGGQNWSQQVLKYNDTEKTDLTYIHFINPQEGWIGGLEGVIFHTSDGGKRWLKQETGYGRGTGITAISFANRNEGWAVGSQYINSKYQTVILYTQNAGANWEPKMKGQEYALPDVQALSNGQAWTVDWNGIVLRTADEGRTWAKKKFN